jgi:hypothetical protein
VKYTHGFIYEEPEHKLLMARGYVELVEKIPKMVKSILRINYINPMYKEIAVRFKCR